MKKMLYILLTFTLFFISPYIISAISITPNDVVEHFKKGDIYTYYSKIDGLTYNVTYDASTKKINHFYNYISNSGGVYYIDFDLEYYENGNYLEYVATSTDKEKVLEENVYLGFILYSIGDLFGCTTDDIDDLLTSDNAKNYKLETDGIYMEYEDVKNLVLSDGTTMNGRMIKKLQIRLDDNPYDSGTGSEDDVIIPEDDIINPDDDITNPDDDITNPDDDVTIPEDEIDDDEIGDDEFGDKEYDDEFEGKDFDDEESVENPSTSDLNIIFIIIAMIACIGIIIIGKNKLSKN